MRLGPFVLALLVAASVDARQAGDLAQRPSVDARWLSWIGCWRPVSPRSMDGSLHVCVVPAGAGGVRILTVAGSAIATEATIVPDGTDRPADDPGCRGSRHSDWSPDGLRLYSSADLTCDNQRARKVSSLSMLTAEGEWIDVQVEVSGTQERVRVRRYQRSDDQPPDAGLIAPGLADRAANSARGTRLTIANVIEASSRVVPRVLEALIFETRASFPIDRKQLILMDDAGVADEVIDVMVAFSFPEKFLVKRSAGASSWGGFDSGGLDWGAGMTAESAWPWYLNPYYAYVGFPYWGVGGDYYYPGWGVEVGDGDGTITPAEPHGRVVNGRGYTQVLRAPDSGQSTPRSRSGGAVSSASGSDSGSSSGGTSSAGSGGYSSGGGGGDSGRTAVPR